MNLVLKNRETIYSKVVKYSKACTIVYVNVVMPGENKRNKISLELISIFKQELSQIFKFEKFHSTHNGYAVILTSSLSPLKTKEICMEIENTHYLGRFIDIDVINEGKQLSRFEKRICPLCENIVTICRREKKHTTDEIVENTRVKVNQYLEFLKLIDVCSNAMQIELKMEPSFGLVNLTSTGSHQDMNYHYFEDSREIVINSLKKVLNIGLSKHSFKDKFEKSRNIAIECENEIYSITNNVNTYKGLIFILFSYILSVTHSYQTNQNVFDCLSKMHQDILQRDFKNSNGFNVMNKYSILGIRKEAIDGFKIIQKASIYNTEQEILVYIMSMIDDTTIINRTDINTSIYVKKLASETIINKKYNNLSNYMLRKNISPGGSADLLIVTLVHKYVQNNMLYNNII